MRKRFTIILAALALVAGACGGSSPSGPDTSGGGGGPDPTPPPAKYTLAWTLASWPFNPIRPGGVGDGLEVNISARSTLVVKNITRTPDNVPIELYVFKLPWPGYSPYCPPDGPCPDDAGWIRANYDQAIWPKNLSVDVDRGTYAVIIRNRGSAYAMLFGEIGYYTPPIPHELAPGEVAGAGR